MRVSSITKNAGKACNNRLYRHIRTFEKIIKNYFVISDTYNGNAWTETTNYTYNETTGAFATVAGLITVPAATFAQNAAAGVITTTPGTAVVTVTGNI